VSLKRYPDSLGVKGVQAAVLVIRKSPGLNLGSAIETAQLEGARGLRNSWCRGEIR